MLHRSVRLMLAVVLLWTHSAASAKANWKRDVLVRHPNLIAQLGHSASVCSSAFSPENQWVLTGGQDGVAVVWELSTGKELRRFQTCEMGQVRSVAFCRDSPFVLTLNLRTAQVWDMTTGQELLRYADCSAISADGWYVLTVTEDRTARVLQAATGREQHQFRWDWPDNVSVVSLSRDGQGLATGHKDGAVLLWNPTTGKEIRKFTGHTGSVDALLFSADSRFNIGQLTDLDKRGIPLAQVKPLLLRPHLSDPKTGRDKLNLMRDLRNQLSIPGGMFAYVDAEEMPGEIRPAGTYTLVGKMVKVTIAL